MGSGTSGKGSSSSRTSQQTTTNTSQSTINTVDNRAVEGDNARLGGNVSVHGSEGINITTTDQGAVQAGLDLALESLGTIKAITNSSQSVQRDVTYQAFDLADKARQSETSNAIQSTLKYGAIIAAIALLAWAFVKSKGK